MKYLLQTVVAALVLIWMIEPRAEKPAFTFDDEPTACVDLRAAIAVQKVASDAFYSFILKKNQSFKGVERRAIRTSLLDASIRASEKRLEVAGRVEAAIEDAIARKAIQRAIEAQVASQELSRSVDRLIGKDHVLGDSRDLRVMVTRLVETSTEAHYEVLKAACRRGMVRGR